MSPPTLDRVWSLRSSSHPSASSPGASAPPLFYGVLAAEAQAIEGFIVAILPGFIIAAGIIVIAILRQRRRHVRDFRGMLGNSAQSRPLWSAPRAPFSTIWRRKPEFHN